MDQNSMQNPGQFSTQNNTQQINNAPMAPDGPLSEVEKPKSKNELLEKIDGKRMDAGAAGTASCDDPEMATVGEIHRAKDAGR
jgi:hypothetical protein